MFGLLAKGLTGLGGALTKGGAALGKVGAGGAGFMGKFGTGTGALSGMLGQAGQGSGLFGKFGTGQGVLGQMGKGGDQFMGKFGTGQGALSQMFNQGQGQGPNLPTGGDAGGYAGVDLGGINSKEFDVQDHGQVKQIQKFLMQNGYQGIGGADGSPDGMFGPKTEAAYRDFMQKNKPGLTYANNVSPEQSADNTLQESQKELNDNSQLTDEEADKQAFHWLAPEYSDFQL